MATRAGMRQEEEPASGVASMDTLRGNALSPSSANAHDATLRVDYHCHNARGTEAVNTAVVVPTWDTGVHKMEARKAPKRNRKDRYRNHRRRHRLLNNSKCNSRNRRHNRRHIRRHNRRNV